MSVSTRVDICCGVGGTGKTTTSAALALAAAAAGERVVVITIDTARRLADALGMDQLGNTPRQVQGVGPGSLEALMLDRKRTWDEGLAKTVQEMRAQGLGYGTIGTKLDINASKVRRILNATAVEAA